MKKLVILNLKDCFKFGLSFNDLAKIETCYLEINGLQKTVVTPFGTLEFQYGNILKNGTNVGFYTYSSIPF